ncbi:MAG: M23 family metallopeptidase [Acidobacteria bacterium]|nr:M23 family metallopeptidase [Acidobacteriota bacterium]MDA1233513.1 M23 family metallopeptidase [Acidobacteriota bacterium]
MLRRIPSPLWIFLAGFSVGGLLAASLQLTTQGEPPAEPSEIPLLWLAGPPPAIPVAYGLGIPGFALPVLDLERNLWADQVDLFGRRILLPIQGITKNKLSDSFMESRGPGNAQRHHAIDLGAPRGRPVLAVEDGTIRRIKWHSRGGLTIYQYGPEGRYSYYYAHLQKVAKGLAEGCLVQRGDVIGYVGSTGSASSASPHLHFEVRKIANRETWWGGDPINPYPLLLAGEERTPDLILNQAAD